MPTTDVALIGAGPIGLELAVNLKSAGVDYMHFDAHQVGHTISWFPKRAQFFSSPDRIAIAGVPLVTADQTKATREEYLAYLRGIVEQFDLRIRTFERVLAIEPASDGFTLRTQTRSAEHHHHAHRVIVATGDMHRPRRLNIEGEELPHVSHYFDEVHDFFRQKLLIVGGRNSAVEAAIRCHRAGAKVALSYRRDTFDARSVKYWLKPELDWLIKTGAITFHPNTTPARITPTHVELTSTVGGAAITVPADFVLLLVGYEMDTSMLVDAGVQLRGANRAPVVDFQTMQTEVPGLYVAGTAVAGTQVRFKLFIENAHPHVVKIMRSLVGSDPKHINALGFTRLNDAPVADEELAES